MNEEFVKWWDSPGEYRRTVCSRMQTAWTGWRAATEATELRVSKALGGMPESELWGDDGLIAATMRVCAAYEASLEEPPKR